MSGGEDAMIEGQHNNEDGWLVRGSSVWRRRRCGCWIWVVGVGSHADFVHDGDCSTPFIMPPFLIKFVFDFLLDVLSENRSECPAVKLQYTGECPAVKLQYTGDAV